MDFSGMDNCCSPNATPQPSSTQPAERIDAFCPDCGQKGKIVAGQTVKSLLSVSLRLVQDSQYYFCRTAACPVVYFNADGSSRFTTDQVRERVYQKEPDREDVKVCYCFYHTAGEIRTSSPADVKEIIAEINAGIQADQCACDLRNPQGSCCLGNVRRLLG
jgi:hypothetical protein